MRKFVSTRLVLAALVLLSTALVQARPKGVVPRWDLKQTLAALTQRSDQLLSILEQVQPKEWTAKGAPKAYEVQWKELRNQLGYLKRAAGELTREPERVSKALEVFLRLQSVETMMNSMIEGVRRYQNPAVAELLQGILNENGDLDQRLQSYLVDLVNTKEAEWKVADEEAQRCRLELIRRPAHRVHPRRRKK